MRGKHRGWGRGMDTREEGMRSESEASDKPWNPMF